MSGFRGTWPFLGCPALLILYPWNKDYRIPCDFSQSGLTPSRPVRRSPKIPHDENRLHNTALLLAQTEKKSMNTMFEYNKILLIKILHDITPMYHVSKNNCNKKGVKKGFSGIY